jgi:hypothetical protein
MLGERLRTIGIAIGHFKINSNVSASGLATFADAESADAFKTAAKALMLVAKRIITERSSAAANSIDELKWDQTGNKVAVSLHLSSAQIVELTKAAFGKR